MSSEKQWPTAEKIKALREQGIFAFSRFTTRAVAAAGLLLGLMISVSWLGEIGRVIREILLQPLTNFAAAKGQLPVLLDLMRSLSLALGFSVLGITVLIILVQSRFFLTAKNLKFSMGQLIKLERLSPWSIAGLLFKGAAGLVFVLAFGLLTLRWILPEFLQVIFSEQFTPSGKLEPAALMPVLRSLSILYLFTLLVLAIVSYFIVRLAFMLKHRGAPEK